MGSALLRNILRKAGLSQKTCIACAVAGALTPLQKAGTSRFAAPAAISAARLSGQKPNSTSTWPNSGAFCAGPALIPRQTETGARRAQRGRLSQPLIVVQNPSTSVRGDMFSKRETSTLRAVPLELGSVAEGLQRARLIYREAS